jgi:hypothetical protein
MFGRLVVLMRDVYQQCKMVPVVFDLNVISSQPGLYFRDLSIHILTGLSTSDLLKIYHIHLDGSNSRQYLYVRI